MDFSRSGSVPVDSQWLQTTAFSFEVLFFSSQFLADSCSVLAAGRISEAFFFATGFFSLRRNWKRNRFLGMRIRNVGGIILKKRESCQKDKQNFGFPWFPPISTSL